MNEPVASINGQPCRRHDSGQSLVDITTISDLPNTEYIWTCAECQKELDMGSARRDKPT